MERNVPKPYRPVYSARSGLTLKKTTTIEDNGVGIVQSAEVWQIELTW